MADIRILALTRSSRSAQTPDRRWRHRVVPTRVEGVAAQQPPDRQRGPTQRPVARDRLQGVRAAGRVEPTAGRHRRAYPTTVRDDGKREHSTTECRGLRHALKASFRGVRGALGGRLIGTPGCRACLGLTHRSPHPCRRPPPRRGVRAAANAPSKSAPSWVYEASAACGRARTTTVAPAGSAARRSRTRWRSRLRTLLRTTALPTARDTTNPARAGESMSLTRAGVSRS
jgi:hypothetical protein